jgi:hypothetical protein
MVLVRTRFSDSQSPVISIVYHSQCGFPVSWLQFEKQCAGFLDVSLRTILSSLSQGNSRGMIRTADESQGFGQAPQSCAVYRCLIHLLRPHSVIPALPSKQSPVI